MSLGFLLCSFVNEVSMQFLELFVNLEDMFLAFRIHPISRIDLLLGRMEVVATAGTGISNWIV